MREPEESSSARHGAEAHPSEGIEEARPRRRRRRKILLLLFGLLAVGVCGGILWRYFSKYESTDDAQVDAHLYPISARVRGYVIRVNAADNEYVQKGSILVEIDPRDYQVAVDQARADLATAEATAQSLHIDVPITATNTSSQLDSTAADVAKAAAGVTAAEKQLAATRARLEQDQANDEAARQSVEQARSALTSAQANHRAARTAPEQVAVTRARAVSAEATVKQKRAALEQAELNLRYTKIVAPVTGQVRKTV